MPLLLAAQQREFQRGDVNQANLVAAGLGAFVIVIRARVTQVRLTDIGVAQQDQDSLAHLSGSRCKQRSRSAWFGVINQSLRLLLFNSNADCATQYGFYHATAAHEPIVGHGPRTKNTVGVISKASTAT